MSFRFVADPHGSFSCGLLVQTSMEVDRSPLQEEMFNSQNM